MNVLEQPEHAMVNARTSISASAIQVYKPVNKAEVRVVYRIKNCKDPLLVNTRHQKSYSFNKYGEPSAWELAKQAFHHINSCGELPPDFAVPSPPNSGSARARNRKKVSMMREDMLFDRCGYECPEMFGYPAMGPMLRDSASFTFGLQYGHETIVVAEGFEAPPGVMPDVIGIPIDLTYGPGDGLPASSVASTVAGSRRHSAPPFYESPASHCAPFLVSRDADVDCFQSSSAPSAAAAVSGVKEESRDATAKHYIPGECSQAKRLKIDGPVSSDPDTAESELPANIVLHPVIDSDPLAQKMCQPHGIGLVTHEVECGAPARCEAPAIAG